MACAMAGVVLLVGLAQRFGDDLATLPRGAATLGGVVTARPNAPLWTFPEPVQSEPNMGSATAPKVIADGQGTLHVVWVSLDADGSGEASGEAGGSTSVHYARRLAGAAWSPPLRIVGGDGRTRTDPALAVDSLGAVHAVWAEYAGRDPDVFHSELPVGASVWSLPERVNDDHTARAQFSPAIAADLWGGIHVAWTDFRYGGPEVFYSRRVLSGAWSRNQSVHAANSGDQARPSLAASRTGWIFAVWEDSRQGRGGIYASLLPPGGDVWWPNAELAHAGSAVQHDPRVAVDARGDVHAVWLDDADGVGTAIRAATLAAGPSPIGKFWGADAVVYRASRGQVLSVDLAGGPGGQVWLAWTETRPEETRIYAGRFDHGTPGARVLPERVDGNPITSEGQQPSIAIDGGPRAHVVWQGRRSGEGWTGLFQSTIDLERPAYAPARAEGWLEYRFGVYNCPGDGYVTVSCDGQYSPFIRAGSVDLASFVGNYVVVTGTLNTDTGCEFILAQKQVLRAPPCPRQVGAVSGRLMDGDAPIIGANVSLGGSESTTGPTGKFALSQLTPGTYVLTATRPCALSAVLPGVPVRPGALTRVEDGTLVAGDVIPDCEINLYDLARVGAQFKQSRPFHPTCTDVDGDGTMSIYDLTIVASGYGLTCPMPWQGRPTPEATGARPAPGVEGAARSRGPVDRLSHSRAKIDESAARNLGLWLLGSGDMVDSEKAEDPSAAGESRRLRDGAPPEIDRQDPESRVGPRRAESLDLVVTRASGWAGAAVTLRFDPDRWVATDMDPRRPGVQPFDLGGLVGPIWVIENDVDEARGELRLAVARLAGTIDVIHNEALPPRDDLLGRIEIVRRSDSLGQKDQPIRLGLDRLGPSVGAFDLVGTDGRRLAGALEVR